MPQGKMCAVCFLFALMVGSVIGWIFGYRQAEQDLFSDPAEFVNRCMDEAPAAVIQFMKKKVLQGQCVELK